MRLFIGLLRGINVGGRNKLPMADLRALCAANGLQDVRSYIQSGNLVFRSSEKPAAISAKLQAEIESRFGFRPRLIILPEKKVRQAAENFPFPTDDHKLAHIMFLESIPSKSAVEELKKRDHEPDRIEVGPDVVNIYFPNGVSGSKMDLARIETILGVSGTSRNWRTVQKLLSMAS